MSNHSETFDDLDDFDDEGVDHADTENANIRLLRRQAERADELQRSKAALEREKSFLLAGVDTDSKLGSIFLRFHEGAIDDPIALAAEARELGIPFLGQRGQAQ